MLKEWWTFLLYALARGLVSLRYRLELTGEENIQERKGLLFLPNHTAEIDPVIVMALLRKKFRPHPLVVEYFYYAPALHFLMRAAGAIPLPAIEGAANAWTAKQIEKLQKQIKEGLEKGENYLIYPSGKLKVTGVEVLGGASFVHSLVQQAPSAHIILVRTTGLWGSTFSKGITGKSPDLKKSLQDGLKILLKNGIFFTPRRTVKVELACAPADLSKKTERKDFNGYLEEWYNRYPEKEEKRTLVSFAFWKEEFPEVTYKEEKKEGQKETEVPKEVQEKIFGQLAHMTGRGAGDIQRSMHLSYDLGLDSLDVAGLYTFLEEQFQIADVTHGELQTVEDLLAAAMGAKKEEQEKEEPPFQWPEEPTRPPVLPPEGETLQEAFLRCCDRMGKRVACIDQLTGLLTYPKFKRAALVLSQKIRALPGDHIGILLPSTSAVYLLIVASLLAKKIPVMLNWTAGERALNHALKVTNLQVVLSSLRFLRKRDIGELGEVGDHILPLEEVRVSLSLKEKIGGLIDSWKNARALLRDLKLNQLKKEDTAVILFTSGTESLPKGVPLSHHNLLSNHRAGLPCVDLKASDILYGVLPPFHSFGFSITGMMPLIIGLRVAYAPNPTDSKGMAKDIARWKPTLFCCAPSFIKALFKVADPAKLASLRLCVSGAEKAPQELFDFVAKLGEGHEMIEGYGITECAPIVTLGPLHQPPKGVGKPLPGIELRVYDEEKKQILPSKQEGEICICGPNVFQGYLGTPKSPFIELEGKRWYRSGDRGYLDEEGFLFLSGRLKRFVKIGGEMVSLGGLEEELLRLSAEKGWAPKKPGKEGAPLLAVTVKEKETDKPLIILFTTFDVSKDDINNALRTSGHAKITKIDEVRRLDEIPLTGTGKTHYSRLDELTN